MYKKFVKRFLDIILSFILIVVLSPLLIILSLLVIIFNGFPVLFKQPRPGKDGKLFMLYKFRSMTNKKDKNGNLLPDSQRITKFGSFIRATSLDELPQLFNILKGDMSFIGPRPRLVKDVILYPSEVKALQVKPGFVCLREVNGHNNNSWETSFYYDNVYVEKMSFKLDLKIFFKTFVVLLKRTGNNSGVVDIQDYYYADYLLRTERIDYSDYKKKLSEAKLIEETFRNSRKLKKRLALSLKQKQFEEDYDLEHKTVD